MKGSRTPTPNLLEHLESTSGIAHGAPWWGKLLLVLLVVLVGGGIYFTSSITTRVSKALSSVTVNAQHGLFSQLRGLTTPAEKQLRGEAQDRINIVILGIGGDGHEGPNLADTIMVASYQPSTKRAALMSIPRDLVVEIPGYGFRKVNSADAYGETKGNPGGGAVLTSSVLGAMLDAPMNYYVRVDFSGFQKLIDDVGGIDLTVDNAFTDSQYPTENFGYQTIRFTAGKQHFDGATALKFVRSRHGNNDEGSDFARSKRQQKVLVALKNKLFSIDTLLNPTRIAATIETLGKHIITNFEPWELMKLVTIGKQFDMSSISTRVLDTTPTGLLINSTGMDGAYILQPRAKNYSEIQQAFATLLTGAPPETARIEIQNGTKLPGLASRMSSAISSPDITVARIKNATSHDATNTTIYDLTGGQKPTTLASLKTKFHADVVTLLPKALSGGSDAMNLSDIGSSLSNGDTLRTFQSDTAYTNIDFVIILGADQLTNEP